MKIILIILVLIVIVKVMFPLIGLSLKIILPILITLIVIGIIALVIFVAAAAFVGLSEIKPEPDPVYDPIDQMYAPEPDDGKTLRESYEWVDKTASKIENALDSPDKK